MALSSTVTPIGESAPAFELPEPQTGKSRSLADFHGKPVLVIFMCNHCPYVIHILPSLVQNARALQQQGIEVIAISSNNIVTHPADSPDKMAELATERDFSFPYLYDESQDIARAYDAQCTPDLYLFDADHKLFYRGQYDETRPNNGTASGKDLMAAASLMLTGGDAPTDVPASVGCGIKWK